MYRTVVQFTNVNSFQSLFTYTFAKVVLLYYVTVTLHFVSSSKVHNINSSMVLEIFFCTVLLYNAQALLL